MTWLLGYGRPDLRYGVSSGGVVTANDVTVTQPEGWLEVALPPEAVRCGAPATVAVALRITHDVLGAAVLHADEITVGTRRHANIDTLLEAGATAWIGHLGAAVHQAVARRIAGGENK